MPQPIVFTLKCGYVFVHVYEAETNFHLRYIDTQYDVTGGSTEITIKIYVLLN